jgi:hypothetical protein
VARITVKDLDESTELDRAAMRAITGGWSGARMQPETDLMRMTFKNPMSFETPRYLPRFGLASGLLD